MSCSPLTSRLLLFMIAVVLPWHANAASPPRVSGMVFADLQDQLHGTAVLADSSSFRFRRVQVTLDQDLDTTFAMRVQLEADETELTSRGRDAVFLKQVYLRWSTHRPFGDIVMGLSPTPTWAFAESFWGYRSLEKTVMDLQGLGVATDLGVALQRTPDATHALGWHAMLSNGAGPKPENSAGKKVSLALPWKHGDVAVEAMGDFEDERGARDKWTARLFAGWMHANDAVGIEAYQRVNANAGVANADVIPSGVSVFGRKALAEHWRAIARLDWTDPDRNISNTGYREVYAVLALDATPSANVHLIPNVLLRSYSAKSSTLPDRDADVTLRVTLWWNYR